MTPSSFKQELLKKWVLGLQSCGSMAKEMSFLERKNAIKLSADIAMASARGGKTRWSRAVISSASKRDDSKLLVRNILGNEFERLMKASVGTPSCNKRFMSKKILRMSRGLRRLRRSTARRRVQASSIAKRMVQRRTQVLKSLVPGGESMDGFSLIEETLDYILSLRAQVDVMRCLADASERLKSK
ncbi:PREDICTED: transcription factor IBH1 [Nelumbo nucifera]|uniref:Transcription factor IBH1 n=1 Tax=Nelumbo nucifera TaxID=4432 RepID=A0A1U8B9Z4_NELNU|nr:PREDICTED: transcription factor IBH1 [Nelumbo nucifera]